MNLWGLVVCGALWTAVAAQDCARREEGDSLVCVCNATYCDQPGILTYPDPASFLLVTSDRAGQRFSPETISKESQETPGATVVRLNRDYVYQTIIGFGGAFSDSAALTSGALSEDTLQNFVKSYFSPEGIGYNLCRIPIAGSDCSTRPYSYDDVVGDTELEFFALADEDISYKIPLILKAKEAANGELNLIGSPWSPPAWMKTNGMFNESGELLKEMWQPYSNYIVKFVEAYEAAGADMWGLTTQNGPLNGFDDNFGWNSCGWTAEDMRDWIKNNLGPTLEAAGLRRLKLMVNDFNRDTLPWYVQPMLEDADSASYIDGTAVHWYSDSWVDASVLDETQALFHDKFILHTEACEGWDVPGIEGSVLLGDWGRAEHYAFRIMENLNHFTTGWVDWNMALDTTGGPNWAGNYLDSPIIVNATSDEFYKQPLFYTMGHFSKFVTPGMRRIYSTSSEEAVYVTAYQEPDASDTAVVLLNTAEEAKDVTVTDGSDTFLNFQMPARSLATLLHR